MGLVEYEGIILRGQDYDEAHRILRVYTWNKGKISVLAKGVKKTKSRLTALCQLFSYGRFLFYKGRNFYTLSQGEILRSHHKLREDLELFAYASYFCELVDLAVEEEDANNLLFSLLLQGFVLLNYGKNIFLAARYFEFRLLVFLGYRPNWEKADLSLEAKAFCKRFLLNEGWRIQNLKPSPAAKEELAAYLRELLSPVLVRSPKSLAFLEQFKH